MILKIIFTIIVAFLGWKLFTALSRAQNKSEKNNHDTWHEGDAQRDGVEDMIECPVCKTYTPKGSKMCGKDRCPFEN